MSRVSFFRLAAIAALVASAVGSATVRGQSPGQSTGQPDTTPAAADTQPVFFPLAILPFQERGTEVKGEGAKATDTLFAELVANPDIYLVEREDLKKLLDEMQLSAAGLTDPTKSTRLGQLTGAKVLITGSIFEVSGKTYVVAKLISTETSRVLGATAKGTPDQDLGQIVKSLADSITAELKARGNLLIPPPAKQEDRLAPLAAQIAKAGPLPSLFIEVNERHVGQATIDPAVETELAKICTDLGFKVIDSKSGSKADADVLLVGEAFSQFAARHENFYSVRARVELKAVERSTGRLLATDRQTVVAADLSELIASKSAFQDAADQLAVRVLPAMLKTLGSEQKKDK